jgi:hypothetical protein
VQPEQFGVSGFYHVAKCLLECCGVVLIESGCEFVCLVSVGINRTDEAQCVDYVTFILGSNGELPQRVG